MTEQMDSRTESEGVGGRAYTPAARPPHVSQKCVQGVGWDQKRQRPQRTGQPRLPRPGAASARGLPGGLPATSPTPEGPSHLRCGQAVPHISPPLRPEFCSIHSVLLEPCSRLPRTVSPNAVPRFPPSTQSPFQSYLHPPRVPLPVLWTRGEQTVSWGPCQRRGPCGHSASLAGKLVAPQVERKPRAPAELHSRELGAQGPSPSPPVSSCGEGAARGRGRGAAREGQPQARPAGGTSPGPEFSAEAAWEGRPRSWPAPPPACLTGAGGGEDSQPTAPLPRSPSP